MPRIWITSVFVDDQAAALSFYTEVLGFQVKTDLPLGPARWLTVVSAQEPDGPELLLEPSGHRAVGPYRTALRHDGIPVTSFAVDDLAATHADLVAKGVHFTQEPTDAGTVLIAVLDDTCGNLIQLVEHRG